MAGQSQPSTITAWLLLQERGVGDGVRVEAPPGASAAGAAAEGGRQAHWFRHPCCDTC